MFGLINSNGDFMNPFLFPHNLRLNTEPPMKHLEEGNAGKDCLAT